ncbi:MAG TPA: helix-turn-helix transcriptional regulator, partial [Thermogutta sp.]|nr:helix-turn-helix transcriptional regulator [Thermogutta sp.]
ICTLPSDACTTRRLPVLNRHLADKILRLLTEERLSQRQVARLTGVSRATIAAIAKGEWHARFRERPKDESDQPPAPSRCPECGALVTPPCLACRIRAMRIRGEILPLPGEGPGPLKLELRGPHYARYLEVRAAAMARGEGEPLEDPTEDAADDDAWSDEAFWADESPSHNLPSPVWRERGRG